MAAGLRQNGAFRGDCRLIDAAHIDLGESTAHGGMLEYRLDKVEALRKIEGRWLDCGCAEGDYSAALLRRGAREVVGTDISETSVEEARSHWAGDEGISFLVAAAEEMPFADETFDFVLLNEVLEHVGDERQTLREIRRVLVPEGFLFVMSPNRWFPFEGHGMLLGRFVIAFPIPLLPWLPLRLTRHVLRARNWWPRELQFLVTEAGFEVVALDFVLPQFGRFPWMPSSLLRFYKQHAAALERRKWVRRFGVSTLIAARKPAHD
jgi:2-polyprenyl-3-methyl-5-hydroxy-6-metoxy-1,4-benzoquinol methylase